jgi:hypothetical protein
VKKPTPKPKKEEAGEESESLENMMEIGYEIEDPREKHKPSGFLLESNPFFTGKSPRFFTLIRKSKKKPKKKSTQLKPVNEEVLQLARKVRKGFIHKMGGNLRSMRNLLIGELAPRVLPTVSAIEEAQDVIKEIVGDKVTSSLYGILMKQITAGSEVKISSWVADYLGMDKDERKRFFARLEADRQNAKELLEMQKLRALQGHTQGEAGILLREFQSLRSELKRSKTKP